MVHNSSVPSSGSKVVCANPRGQQNAAVKRGDGADTLTPGDTNACQQTTESHSVVDSNCDKACQTRAQHVLYVVLKLPKWLALLKKGSAKRLCTGQDV